MSSNQKEYPRITYVEHDEGKFSSKLIGAVERISGRKKLESVYHRIKDEGVDDGRFFARALQLAEIRYRVHGISTGFDSKSFPEGPLVLIANHPFGVVDGLILCDLASRLRPDFAILINALLCRDPDLDRFFLPIDFSETKRAMATNIRSKRTALDTLAANGVVLVFPSGGISTRSRGGIGPVQDLPWTTFTAKLIAQSRATVLPFYFHGCNSRLFHVASNLHPALRASLLLHEARNKMGRTFEVVGGDPIPYDDVQHLDRQALTEHLYRVTTGLRNWPLTQAACAVGELTEA